MVSNSILIGITVVVFFAGIGISYAIFSSSYDPYSMKFQNQQLFDQMMSQNPKMTAQWMTTTMQDPQQMQQLMSDPEFRQQMFQQMKGSSGMMSGSTMSDMQFNVDAPIIMPMIDGYYNGEKVYFLHTEISDSSHRNIR